MTTIAEARPCWGLPAPDQGAYAGPATITQIGALHREFARLGFRTDDREERLELAAELLGLDGLGSFRGLSLGKAGWLLSHVSRCGTLAELEEAVASAAPPEEPAETDLAEGLSVIDALVYVVLLVAIQSAQRRSQAGEWSPGCIPGTPDAAEAQRPAQAREGTGGAPVMNDTSSTAGSTPTCCNSDYVSLRSVT